MMPMRLNHILGFMFLTVVCAPTEMCELEEEDTFYAKLNSVIEVPPIQPHGTLIVLGGVNAALGPALASS